MVMSLRATACFSAVFLDIFNLLYRLVTELAVLICEDRVGDVTESGCDVEQQLLVGKLRNIGACGDLDGVSVVCAGHSHDLLSQRVESNVILAVSGSDDPFAECVVGAASALMYEYLP